MRGLIVGAGLATLLVGTNAAAQFFVREDCRPVISAPQFDDVQHGQWYQRFWTGACGNLLFCSAGSPYWNEVVSTLRGRAAPARAAQVTRRACILGQRIGLEWARDNGVRRINSNDLVNYVATVQQGGDVEARLSSVEVAVNARLGTR